MQQITLSKNHLKRVLEALELFEENAVDQITIIKEDIAGLGFSLDVECPITITNSKGKKFKITAKVNVVGEESW